MSPNTSSETDPYDRNTAIALFRYGLIAQLVHTPPDSGQQESLLRDIAARTYTIPGSTRTRVSLTTLRRYLKTYVAHGFDALRYLDAIPAESVREIHLAGFDSNGQCLIDTHGRPVAGPVWNLYGEALSRVGPMPTLIEWDTDLPPLSVLLDEARKAQEILDEWIATEVPHALAA